MPTIWRCDALQVRTEPDDPTGLLTEVERSTRRILETIRLLDEGIDGPSLLPGWSRRMIVAHLAYVASAYLRVTDEALAHGRAETYVSGSRERADSLHSLDSLSAGETARAFEETGDALQSRWEELTTQDWAVEYEESRLGLIALSRLIALRLTELEVHHGDLGLGYGPRTWSDVFVTCCLPLRIAWLEQHHRKRTDAHLSVEGRWLLRSGSRAWLVVATDRGATAEVVPSNAQAEATIDGEERDLLAFLLGREPGAALRLSGDLSLCGSFKAAFPGP